MPERVEARPIDPQLIDKAHILVEALPYIRKFADKVFVIKYGGSAMAPELHEAFAKDVTLLRYIGIRPVIVHGGGPQIGQLLKRLGKESVFIDGMRVTDDETMEVVEMVLGGRINAEIVHYIGRAGGRGVGLTGKDCGFLRVRKLDGPNGEDLGRVGAPDWVDPDLLLSMSGNGFIPVVAPIGTDALGKTYNVNADSAAGCIAEALRAEKLILLTDVDGVLDGQGRLLGTLEPAAVREAIAAGVVKGGMIPKLDCCVRAVQNGVVSTHIIDGRVPHSLLLEIFTDGGVGTKIARGVSTVA
jgi:acetylglutamate kinase